MNEIAATESGVLGIRLPCLTPADTGFISKGPDGTGGVEGKSGPVTSARMLERSTRIELDILLLFAGVEVGGVGESDIFARISASCR